MGEYLMAGTTEQIDQVCQLLSEGKSLRSIARQIGMAESTLRYWLSNDEAAFAQSARARELGCDALADECLEIADQLGGDPADKRIRIDTRIRLIGKWSQRYSDRIKHVGGDEGDAPIKMQVQEVRRVIVDPSNPDAP